ncbi:MULTISPECIES: hypothetical protein, partial [Citromicrobium]|uniref:hypothetical protein n=1 Tax=Citromicrobium TaxID=72173 RepID=UPI001E5A35FF
GPEIIIQFRLAAYSGAFCVWPRKEQADFAVQRYRLHLSAPGTEMSASTRWQETPFACSLKAWPTFTEQGKSRR